MTKKSKIISISAAVVALVLIIGCAFIFFKPEQKYLGERVYKGLYYAEQQVVNKDGKNVNTFIITVDKNLKIVTGVPNDEVPLKAGLVQETSLQAEAAYNNGKNVLAAINADFFYMGKDDMIQPCSVTVKDGLLLTNFNKTRFDRGCFFGVKKDGTLVFGDELSYKSVRTELYQAVGGGPWLIKYGKVPVYDDKERHPRAAIGVLEDGAIILVVADGRTSESAGFTINEMANYMLSLGAVEAINLDGGGSATLVVKDPESDLFFIKNDPSDKYERPVANSLLVVGK